MVELLSFRGWKQGLKSVFSYVFCWLMKLGAVNSAANRYLLINKISFFS